MNPTTVNPTTVNPIQPSTHTWQSLPDLLSARTGGEALLASDEFFAGKENLTLPGRGVFIVDKYTDRGKWMDGWESRRKRGPGYDWCILRLGMPGVIHGVDIDTNHFTGNFPEFASLDACIAPANASGAELQNAPWVSLLGLQPLQGGSQNLFTIQNGRRQSFTHVRLNIHPDGGVARLRIHGEVQPDWTQLGHTPDVAALQNGGRVVLSSNMYFGQANNLLMPGRGVNMGDGWESKRRRGPGNDWCILQLGAVATLSRLEIDTAHFKGNYPDTASVEGCLIDPSLIASAPPDYFASLAVAWKELLPRTKLEADKQHFYEKELKNIGPVSHVRLSIYPDGGVSRFRAHGALHVA